MKNVIHIFGASGSGTTTLGRRIQRELGFTHLDADDYYWVPTDPPYREKRPIEQRLDRMLRDLERPGNAVVSGSLTGWGDGLIPYFTLAIRVYTDTALRIERLKQRERAQFGQRIAQGGDMYQEHMAFLRWAAEYDTGDLSIRSKARHDQWQQLLQCEILEVDGADIPAFDMDAVRRRCGL